MDYTSHQHDANMRDETSSQDQGFKYTLNLVRDQLALLREDLARYKELKQRKLANAGDPTIAQQVKELDVRTKMRLLVIRSGQRSIFQMVEHMKRQSEDERRNLDQHNLTLQSLLYGKDFFLKEVHQCKEYKTPNLQQALTPEIYAERFRNIAANITEQERSENFGYLAQQLKERELLTKKLRETEGERSSMEHEFVKRQRVLEEFPQTLEKLEKATVPIQQHLGQKLSEERQLFLKSENLPLPLNTVFRKLYQFQNQHPQFGIDVQIKGYQAQDDSDELEQFYLRQIVIGRGSQVMYNEKMRQKVQNMDFTAAPNVVKTKEREKSPKQAVKEQVPPIVVKAAETVIAQPVSSKPPLIEPNGLEEGEEDPNSEANQASEPLKAQFDLEDKPLETLINKYAKFPLYIEVVIQHIADFFSMSEIFTVANIHSLKLVNEATKSSILFSIFPLRLRIQLIPDLNVLTVEFDNKTFKSDQILAQLSSGDSGKQLKVKDLSDIIQDTNERIYEWLHNWAGLYLEVQKPQRSLPPPEGFIPSYKTDYIETAETISTKFIIHRIWQRLISKSVLNLQIGQFLERQAYLKEVAEEMERVMEFKLLGQGGNKGHIKEFKKGKGANQYEVHVEREKYYDLRAIIDIPKDYPESPPRFRLTMNKFNSRHSSKHAAKGLPEEIMKHIQHKDLQHVNDLRSQQANLQPCDLYTQEPIQPLLDCILDELHLFHDDYCSPPQRDLLLSFQLRKLIGCLDILEEINRLSQFEASHSSGLPGKMHSLNGLYRTAIKGKFKKRPFGFNGIRNMLEQR
ncbi:hypothetical protein FGO68_gene6114 [Halteria grandinella]|uniref:THO complex subunit 5 n=1 Tax=Halteria grandinella TaxID=5974 RepID=A0A8J8P076_HALGN|nr:hypothetical protein FGO68_gene6114 [Halteria grandinella]